MVRKLPPLAEQLKQDVVALLPHKDMDGITDGSMAGIIHVVEAAKSAVS
ncbi:MAG: hypothetical protein LBP74_08740 [Treponema sp.]|jgi:hypothetical protein|nr:hypothetical protein [Treponema sp.]